MAEFPNFMNKKKKDEPPHPEIRDHIPLPPRTRGRPNSKKYSFLEKLDVGQRAFFRFDYGQDDEMRKFRQQLSSVVTRYKKTSGKQFTIRTCEDDGDPGIGIWRMEDQGDPGDEE